MSVTRLLASEDALVLAGLLRENRAFLEPWQPRRDDEYFTDRAQQQVVANALEDRGRGRCLPLVIHDGGRVEGMITLQSIIRGSFQSCSVGYWLAAEAQGRGLATAALQEATRLAFQELRLHRVQAETLPHNGPSQRVLLRVGFVPYGTAAAYLKIAGAWQDHVLYQLLNPEPGLVVVPEQ
jgi:ribosomal-protein-alanine N-acetyltransferase